ncbi:MAG: GNAT family N-acetyltransferase, partial [Rhodospirillales bacterium]
ERPSDRAAIENLLDAAFGRNRHAKASYRFRDGVEPLGDLKLVARERHKPGGQGVVGTLRFWPVLIGGAQDPALLLGPLAVSADWRGLGVGGALMRQGLDMAAWARHRVVLLVGDMAYYGRFGFRPAAERGIAVPGEDPARVLARGLCFGAFAGVAGPVRPWRAVRPGARIGRAIAA